MVFLMLCIAFKLHTFGKISMKDLLCFTSKPPFSSLRTTLVSNLAFLDEHNCGYTIVDTQLWIHNEGFKKRLERE